MSLSFKAPERDNVRLGYKVSILFCKLKSKGCKFYLEFHIDKETNNYELKGYYNCHSHPSNDYDPSSCITQEICAKIQSLKSSGVETRAITNIINKDSKKNFHWRTIYYQLRKFTDQTFGKMSDDAPHLCQLFEKDSQI